MFTGIIEATGKLEAIEKRGSNVDFWLSSPITQELKIDQSLAHNGVCLTVVAFEGDRYKVTAVDETLKKTNLGSWLVGDTINLERAMKLGDRLDGHLVQGHVDGKGVCTEVQELEGSWLYRFSFSPEFAGLLIEKGSVCINGVSLTVFNVGLSEFTVTIIPYTHTHTNFSKLTKGMEVNLEFDVMGKYLLRQQQLLQQKDA